MDATRRHQLRVRKFGHLGGMPERFERPHATADEIADD